MGDLSLPQPTKNARDVIEITSALIQSIPGVSVLKAFLDIQLNRKLELAMNLLAEEVRKSGIEVLAEDQYQFYLPSAYRFAEQVRLGDYEHNLKILRRMLIEGLKSNSTDSGKIGRHARQLEYLSEFEIGVLAATQKYIKSAGDSDDPSNCAGSEELISNGFIEEHIDQNSISAALTVLSGRGLLIPNENPSADRVVGTYRLSRDGDYVALSAMESPN